MDKISPYLKAIVAFITPGVVGLVAAVQDGSPGNSDITLPEWVGILAACLLTSAGVYGIPNKDPKALHQDESVQPPTRNEFGYGAIELLVTVLVVLILVFVLLRVAG